MTDKKKGHKYAVVDLEATGTGLDAKIIQVGIVIVQNGQIIETYQTDVNPHERLTYHIKELTGITDKQLAQAPDFAQVAGQIYDLIEDAIFVAHNVKFDANLLAEALFFEGFDLLTPRVDTVELAQLFFPTFEKYGLAFLAEKLELELEQAHTAISDAMATAQLLLKIQTKIANLPKETVANLLELADNLIYESRLVIDEIYPSMSDYVPEDLEVIHGLALKKPKDLLSPRRLSEDFAVNLALLGLDNREEQAHFAQLMSQRLEDGEHRVHFIQAQAGIGKTYGYLLPLLAQKQRLLVVVPTKVLQQQIMENEGQKLAETFHLDIQSIKSAEHYIHLERYLATLNREDSNRLLNRCKMQILVWLCETETGDMDELKQKYVYPSYFDELRHDANPLRKDLFYSWDFWKRLQDKALQSQVIVTNHAYFLRHVKDEAELMSQHLLVIDEAQRFLLAVEEFSSQTIEIFSVMQQFQSLKDQATELLEVRLLESCQFELDKVVALARSNEGKEIVKEDLAQLRQSLMELGNPDFQDFLDCLTFYDNFWVEETIRGEKQVRLLRASLADLVRAEDLLDNPKIFAISATLDLNKRLNIADLLGFENVSLDYVPSHVNENQRIYQVADLPSLMDWSQAEHAAFLAYRLRELCTIGQPILVLFTSISLLLAVSEELETAEIDHLAQHKHGDASLLKRKFEKGDAKLLLGTGAFWQGVDFAHQDKVVEVITRLPFDNPRDRFTQKVNLHLRQSGKSPFYDYGLPMMMVRLKQALGRTTRSENQRSAVLILDPRLVERRYGKQVQQFLEEEYHVEIGNFSELVEIVEIFLD